MFTCFVKINTKSYEVFIGFSNYQFNFV